MLEGAGASMVGSAVERRGPLALLRRGRTLRVLTLSALVDGMMDRTYNIRSVHAQHTCGLGPAEYVRLQRLSFSAFRCVPTVLIACFLCISFADER